jgi:hypothetical protein
MIRISMKHNIKNEEKREGVCFYFAGGVVSFA